MTSDRQLVRYYFEHYAHQEMLRMQRRQRLDYLYFRKHGVHMPTNIERVMSDVRLNLDLDLNLNRRRLP